MKCFLELIKNYAIKFNEQLHLHLFLVFVLPKTYRGRLECCCKFRHSRGILANVS